MTDLATTVLFVIGAGAGAPLRYVTDGVIGVRSGRAFPLGTLAVNVVGSALLGVVTALGREDVIGTDLVLVLGTGFCGAFTTFSTFAVETIRLVEGGDVRAAVSAMALTTVASVLAAAASFSLLLAVL